MKNAKNTLASSQRLSYNSTAANKALCTQMSIEQALVTLDHTGGSQVQESHWSVPAGLQICGMFFPAIVRALPQFHLTVIHHGQIRLREGWSHGRGIWVSAVFLIWASANRGAKLCPLQLRLQDDLVDNAVFPVDLVLQFQWHVRNHPGDQTCQYNDDVLRSGQLGDVTGTNEQQTIPINTLSQHTEDFYDIVSSQFYFKLCPHETHTLSKLLLKMAVRNQTSIPEVCKNVVIRRV